MKSFESGVLERHTIPTPLLRTARLLGEYRARQQAFERRSSLALDRLRETALLQSIESSSRLDGVTLPADRFAQLLTRGADPDSRAEQEIAGYREALATVAGDAGTSDLTSHLVLQLHAGLYRFVPEGGGCWKMSDDLVTETCPDGSTAVVFTPVPAYGVEDAMNRLHEGFARHVRAGIIDPLLLVPSYLLDFLCIHPFADGNDRMLRLLAMLLLGRAGYRVTTFVSLDPLFEQSAAACSAALQASWRGWHRATHDLAPWWQYFLGVLVQAYEQFERELELNSPPRGAKRDMVVDAVRRLPADFRHVDLEHLVPSVSRPTINRVLRRLRAAREVVCVKPGRNARWRRSGK
jgi:Fic family protein